MKTQLSFVQMKIQEEKNHLDQRKLNIKNHSYSISKSDSAQPILFQTRTPTNPVFYRGTKSSYKLQPLKLSLNPYKFPIQPPIQSILSPQNSIHSNTDEIQKLDQQPAQIYSQIPPPNKRSNISKNELYQQPRVFIEHKPDSRFKTCLFENDEFPENNPSVLSYLDGDYHPPVNVTKEQSLDLAKEIYPIPNACSEISWSCKSDRSILEKLGRKNRKTFCFAFTRKYGI